MKPKVGIVFLVIAGLGACAHRDIRFTPSEVAFAAVVKSWEGSTEAELVDGNGYPTAERKSPTGNRVLEYVSRGFETSPTSASTFKTSYGSATEVSGGQTKVIECTTWYELESNKVKKVTWRGDSCVVGANVVLGMLISEAGLVVSVSGNSAAEIMGIKTGDWIVEYRKGKSGGAFVSYKPNRIPTQVGAFKCSLGCGNDSIVIARGIEQLTLLYRD